MHNNLLIHVIHLFNETRVIEQETLKGVHINI